MFSYRGTCIGIHFRDTLHGKSDIFQISGKADYRCGFVRSKDYRNNADRYYYFEVSDYSHYEEDQPGVFSFNGSYLKESKYVQTNVNINSLFADGILNIISSLMAKEKSEKLQSISSMMNPYMFSGDLYFSSDFKTFSYNVPYILAANTKKENQAVMISFNGNNESVQLDNVSFIMNKIAVDASGMLEFSNNYKDFLFSLDILNEASKNGELTISEAVEKAKTTSATLKKLEQNGNIEIREENIYRNPLSIFKDVKMEELATLNEEQSYAAKTIINSLSYFCCFILLSSCKLR